MWSEEWDDKIREAAAQAEATTNAEQGWQQMEPLLEKHLPVDRRRKRFFLLLFLLISAGFAVYLNSRPIQKNGPDRQLSVITPASKKTDPSLNKNATNNISHEKKQSDNGSIAGVEPNQPLTAAPVLSRNQEIREPAELPAKKLSKSDGSARRSTSRAVPTNQAGISKEKETNPVLPYISDSVAANNTGSQPHAGSEHSMTAVLPDFPDSIHGIPPVTQQHVDSPTPENSSSEKNPRWALSLAAGADISATQPDNPGQWRPAMGVLLQYRITPKFWIRTGFLATRKVYDAGPDDYKPPKIFWNYVSELKHVEANCLVYEIPMWLQYRFGQNGTSPWSISAGFSSILMKKEDYDYEVRDLGGQERYLSRSYNNYSNHLFSTLHLSAGYRLSLSGKWSLGAEPYIKLPLSGIGYGNVKLYSAGIMLSATITK